METKTSLPWRICRHNVWVPASWCAFLLLQVRSYWASWVAWGVAALGSVMVMALPPLWKGARAAPKGLQGFAALTAAGIAQAAANCFLLSMAASERAQSLLARLPIDRAAVPLVVALTLMCLSLPALFVLLMAFYKRLFPALSEVCRSLSRPERGSALVCVALLMAVALWLLPQLRPVRLGLFDVVYTADSAISLKANAYLSLVHPENDLRQPLFAVFAAPWMGAFSLFSETFRPWVPWVPAFGAACGQAVATVFGLLLLARMAGLRGAWTRATFLLWACMGYGITLFAVVPEQYAIAFAWLMLFLATRHMGLPEVSKQRGLAFLGAAGTLVTSAVAAVFVLPWRKVRVWVGLCSAYGVAMLFFMRLDQVLALRERIGLYREFSGEGLPFIDRLRQWIAFASMMVRAPEAEPWGNGTAWRLVESPDWGFVPGLCVLGAVAVCAAMLARRAFTWVCLGWIAFSFLLLCVVGWGTAENGLILYVPYFAWAFMALLGGGIAALAERFHLGRWVVALFLGLAALTAWGTLAALARMVAFFQVAWPV